GRTVSNKVVNFNGNNSLIGSLVTVNIKRSFLNSLRAELT
ncbi:MAG: TRAM domain-containing protein, partial [Desulfobacteraceae bacterium]|nr:TRAM domain-containing protein [Desulfobacteraceae bacterium]